MQYYITASVTGRMKITDKDSFDPNYLAATIIGTDAEKIANKLRKQGFKVSVELTHGTQD